MVFLFSLFFFCLSSPGLPPVSYETIVPFAFKPPRYNFRFPNLPKSIVRRRGEIQKKFNGFTRKFRWFRVPTEANIQFVFHTIILINICVFLLWKLSELHYAQGDWRYFNFMRRNFMISVDNFREGRIWTMWTQAFSHKDFDHLLVNMFVFWNFGKIVSN